MSGASTVKSRPSRRRSPRFANRVRQTGCEFLPEQARNLAPISQNTGQADVPACFPSSTDDAMLLDRARPASLIPSFSDAYRAPRSIRQPQNQWKNPPSASDSRIAGRQFAQAVLPMTGRISRRQHVHEMLTRQIEIGVIGASSPAPKSVPQPAKVVDTPRTPKSPAPSAPSRQATRKASTGKRGASAIRTYSISFASFASVTGGHRTFQKCEPSFRISINRHCGAQPKLLLRRTVVGNCYQRSGCKTDG